MKALIPILLLAAAPFAFAEVKITNPGLADKETLKYTETIGSLNRPFDATLGLGADGSRYEYRTVGADVESVYRLDRVTLLSLSSETVTKAPDATVKKTAEYLNLKPNPGADDLVVTDLGSLPVALRGFPFGKVTAAKILYVGNTSFGGAAVTFELAVTGRETVVAGGKSWECWHVTTGLGGALSLMMAKTEWWFAVDGTHPLVKTSGPSGGPGSPMRVLVLQTYAVGK